MKLKRMHWCALLGAALLGGQSAWALFGPKGDDAEEKRSNVRKQRDEMLEAAYAAKPELKKSLPSAVGYATFKQTNMNLLLLATSNGYGVAVDNKTKKETFMRIGGLGGGIGAGIKDMRVVFVFRDAKTMQQFIESGWQFGGSADASAKYEDTGVAGEQAVKGTASKDGVSATGSREATAGTSDKDKASAHQAGTGGMEIYQFTESGLSLQATVQGTKYWKDDELNK